MDKTVLFFYGLIIFSITTTGISVLTVATVKENKQTKTNHTNFGSD